MTPKPLIAFLALIALLLGQSAAGLHALTHVRSKGDSAGAPGQHAPLCLECASFAPLAGAHGGSVIAPVVAFVATDGVVPLVETRFVSKRLQSPSQARAPPR
jgi:hypothetical protein